MDNHDALTLRLDRSIENTATVGRALHDTPLAMVMEYLKGCVGNGVRRADKGLKWAEVLFRRDVLTQAQYADWIRQLSKSLTDQAEAAPVHGPIGAFAAWSEDEILKSPSRQIVLLASGYTTKVSLCVHKLLSLGVPPHLLLYAESAEGLVIRKPYSMPEEAWYPNARKRSSIADMPLPASIPRLKVESFRDIPRKVPSFGTVLLIFGMPVLPAAFIAEFDGSILNAHNGPLPYVRGLDSPAWCALKRMPFAACVHLVSSNIDGGLLLFRAEPGGGSKMEFNQMLAEQMALAGFGLSAGLSLDRGTELDVAEEHYYSAMSIHSRAVVQKLSYI